MRDVKVIIKFDFKALIDRKAAVAIFLKFFFRERNFSLKIRAIRPSADFGARRENDLRGTGYAWTPVLVSFFKLFKVGFSPYLGFIPIFKCFSMFRLV